MKSLFPAISCLHLLFFVSGATGLMCEVVWTRWLTGVLGNASAATAIVLAVFMGGLGAGCWLSARLADRLKHPVRMYAFAELGVGSLVMLPFWGSRLTEPLLADLASWLGPTSMWLHVVRIVTAVLALGPPALLMGLSFPLVVRAMVTSRKVLGRSTASAYAANSLGGVAGTVLTGFVMIETFGLIFTALIASSLAVAVGIAALWWDGRISNTDIESESGVHANSSRSKELPGKADAANDRSMPAIAPRAATLWILAAAAVSGFCALGYETVWSRVLSVLTLNTTYAFTLMLAVLLFGLSLGSWLIGRRLDRLHDPAAWFVTLQILLSVHALSSVLWSTSIVDAAGYLISSGERPFVASWITEPLAIAASFLLVPSMLMGASLPLVCKVYATATEGVGLPVGRVYAANTFGSVAGALLVGLVVIPSFGSGSATVFCAVLGSIAAATVSWFYTARDRRIVFTAGSGAVAVVAVALILTQNDMSMTGRSLNPHDDVVFRSEDEYGLVEVVEDQRLGTQWMLTNRLHWEGSTLPRAVAEQRKQGLLPLVLHGSSRRVLEIGVGTGIKLSALDIPAVEHAVAVEISPGVIRASRFFADYNHNITAKGTKVQIVCADGREFVKSTPQTFDVIVNGLLTPYRAGVSRLYTVEHFRSCHAKLAEGGLFVVWVAIRQIAPDDLKTLSRSLLEVFPHTTLWLDGYYAALISTKAPIVYDADEIAKRCSEPDYVRALNEAGIDSPFTILASFVAGSETLARFAGNQPLNTEDRPIIEFRTPRLGSRLNTDDLAAEMIGTLSLLQEPAPLNYISANKANRAKLLQALRARWTARQALIQKCYGNHVEAARTFHAALALDRADDLARYELETYLVAHGKQCVERGLLDRAHGIFRQAVDVNPRSIGALASLAALEENAGNRQKAEQIWQRVLSLAPQNRHLRQRVAHSSSGQPIRTR